MDVIVPVRCDYFTLDPICGYCGEPATCLRVTTLEDGRIHVLSQCLPCARGEREAQISKGWRTIEDASTIVDPELVDSLPPDLRATLSPQIVLGDPPKA